MLNIAIPQIPFKGRLSIDYSFLIIVIGIGSTLGVIATSNDAMAQPFRESKSVDYLFKVSDSKPTLANNPDGQCPEGTVQASPPLNPQLGCIPNKITSEPNTDESPERTSNTATLANNPDGQCPEGTVQASPPLNPQIGCIPNNETSEPNG